MAKEKKKKRDGGFFKKYWKWADTLFGAVLATGICFGVLAYVSLVWSDIPSREIVETLTPIFRMVVFIFMSLVFFNLAWDRARTPRKSPPRIQNPWEMIYHMRISGMLGVAGLAMVAGMISEIIMALVSS